MLAMLCAACSSGRPPLEIGAIISRTGMIGTHGLNHLQAIELAADEINAAGGVLGKSIEVANQDDQSTAAGATAAAHELVDNRHVPAILGAITSDASAAAQAVAAPHQVVLISGGATAPGLSDLPYFFRTCPADDLQGALLAERAWMHPLAHQRVAVTFDPGVYGSALAAVFVSHYEAMGGMVSFNQAFSPGLASYLDWLRQIYATNPDAILLVAYARDAAQFIRDYNSAFLGKETFWFFTDSSNDSSFVQGVGASNFTFQHEGTVPAGPSGPMYQSFATAFQTRYSQMPEGSSPQFYDATYLLALAIEQAGRVDGAAIANSLRTVADPPGIVVGPGQWSQAQAALRAGSKVNYDGVSGPVDLDAHGGVVGPYDIWQIVDGQITVVQRSVSP
jgi:branched-chain amino acid transport system substrate-binding protein